MAIKTFTAELPKRIVSFAIAYSKKQAVDNYKILEIVESDLSQSNKNKQVQVLGYNKRHSASLLIDIEGKKDSAVECRKKHIETLEAKITSAERQIKKWQKQLDKLKYPCCDIRRNQFKTQQHCLRFKIHHKKRYVVTQQLKLAKIQNTELKVNLGTPNNFIFVGSKGETKGNSNCQYDVDKQQIKIRVTPDLEAEFGKYVTADLYFKYGQDCLVAALMRRSLNRKTGEIYPAGKGEALTWRIYNKNNRWYISVSLEVTSVPLQSKPVQYGCIGVDLNPSVIGWAYVDYNGNLIESGQFKTNLHSRTSGQIKASLACIAAQLVEIANKYACPIVIERLDFSVKKNKMREQGRKYARMLSSFAYNTFKEVLDTRCRNTGIELIKVNPAYSSLIALTKFMRRLGLSSDTAAGLVIARRAMRLSESVPAHFAPPRTANVVVARRHVWASWRRLSRKLKTVRRHNFYQVPLTADSSDIFVGFAANNARLDDQLSSCSVSDKR
ncbi:MAG: IS200/IS605 family accessory protein TnpB-related protein [Cyanobacteria bacterium J06635_10]